MNDEAFDELSASLTEADEIRRGERRAARVTQFAEPDVKAIREGGGYSQNQFATLIGVNLRTLQNWEQGHRKPNGPARVWLTLAQTDPTGVFKSLHMTRAQEA